MINEIYRNHHASLRLEDFSLFGDQVRNPQLEFASVVTRTMPKRDFVSTKN